MFVCWQVFFHSKPQVHTKQSTLKSETSVPNVSKPPFPPPFFLWICYFVTIQVKKTHRGQVINAGCNLRILLEPKPLSLPLYKWVKDNWRTLQLQIALTQGSSLRCRCNDNYEKKNSSFGGSSSKLITMNRAVTAKTATSSCSMSPGPLRDEAPFLLPHVCSLMSLFWRVLSLSHVWDWEQSLVLVPAPTLLITDCHFQLQPRRESRMPGALFSPVCLACILATCKASNMHCS